MHQNVYNFGSYRAAAAMRCQTYVSLECNLAALSGLVLSCIIIGRVSRPLTQPAEKFNLTLNFVSDITPNRTPVITIKHTKTLHMFVSHFTLNGTLSFCCLLLFPFKLL